MLRKANGAHERKKRSWRLLLTAITCVALLGVPNATAIADDYDPELCSEADTQARSCASQCSTSPYFEDCILECKDFIEGEYPSCSDRPVEVPIDYDSEIPW
ncbi:MAG: hypothetical protein MI919_20240 [Holophagales bacterium]|nr:hypothetical protein [Holophagales bacterium]